MSSDKRVKGPLAKAQGFLRHFPSAQGSRPLRCRTRVVADGKQVNIPDRLENAMGEEKVKRGRVWTSRLKRVGVALWQIRGS